MYPFLLSYSLPVSIEGKDLMQGFELLRWQYSEQINGSVLSGLYHLLYLKAHMHIHPINTLVMNGK